MEKIKIIIGVILYLIKTKGYFKIDMQEDSFDNNYFVDRDNEDNYIKTSLWDLIEDIYYCRDLN